MTELFKLGKYRILFFLKPSVHNARNWSEVSDGERINQSHLNNLVIFSHFGHLINAIGQFSLRPRSWTDF